MKESDIVATMTVHYASEGEGQVAAGANTVAASQDKVTASSNAMATATETSARRQTSAAAAFNAMARSIDPINRAFDALQKNQATLDRALSQNSSMLDKAGQSLDYYKVKLEAAAVAAEALRRQQSNITTDPSAVTGSVKGTPISLNQITGAQANVGKEYAAQFEAAAKAQDDMVAASNRLKAALNPLAAEEAKQVEWLGLMKQAQQAGMISAEQFAGAQRMSSERLANLSQSLKAAGTAGRVMSGEMTNLGFQLNDVVTGLALGQSPFMILAQQGGQIVQIFANSKSSIADFASSSLTWLRSLITPMSAIITVTAAAAAAVAALALQYDRLQVSAQKAISGAGARTGTTTSDINAFVDKNTPSAFSGSTLSQKESRLLGEELTKTGDIVISKLNSMSAAVVGFSNQTGQSMDDAIKAFARMASDPVKALDELAKAFGPFSQDTRNLVQDMVGAGDKTLAWNAILKELGPTAKNTAGNMTGAELAVRGLSNALQTTQSATGLEKQLEDVRQKLNAAIEAANQWKAIGIAAPPEVSNSIEALSRQFEQLYARQQAVINLKVSAVFDDVADKANKATEAIIPQIQQLKQMEQRLNELKAARDNGSGGPDNSAAIIAQQNVIQKTQEAKAEAARYNEQVAMVSQSWMGVSQSTALALQAAQNQLPVIQAITGAQQIAAQGAQVFADAILAGKSRADALALSMSSVTAATAAATAAVMKQVEALKDSNDMLKAQATGHEKSTAAAIAYKNAIASGASEESAIAIKAETARTYTIKAAAAALEWQQNLFGVGKAAQSVVDAIAAADVAQQNAAEQARNTLLGGNFTPDATLTHHEGNTAGTLPQWQLDELSNSPKGTDSIWLNGVGWLGGAAHVGDPGWTLGVGKDRTDTTTTATTKNTTAIDKLTNSTNDLNNTMGDLLSPLYEQDPRTSHIGYRSQGMSTTPTDTLPGMAGGGEFIVPGGYSANDNMLLPVASGEAVAVGRPGQDSKWGGGPVINISMPMTFNGPVNKDEVGRTAYQSAQNAARQLKAAAQ